METPGGGILGRIGERVLSWIALGGLIALGAGIYWMDSGTKLAIWNGIWRTAAWLVIVAGLPWVARLFIRRILEMGSNWAPMVMIAAFVVIDAIAGAVLMSGLPTGGWSWVAALAALAVAGTYNFLVAEYLAEQAGG